MLGFWLPDRLTSHKFWLYSRASRVGALIMVLWNIFFSSPSLWKVVMRIPGSSPARGMWYSRNVSGALCYCSALIRFISRKLNFAPPPSFLWLKRFAEPRLYILLRKLLRPYGATALGLRGRKTRGSHFPHILVFLLAKAAFSWSFLIMPACGRQRPAL